MRVLHAGSAARPRGCARPCSARRPLSAWWLRALGAKVGRGAEVSTVAHLDPDLLVRGRESFVADMASVGGATFHHGKLVERPADSSIGTEEVMVA